MQQTYLPPSQAPAHVCGCVTQTSRTSSTTCPLSLIDKENQEGMQQRPAHCILNLELFIAYKIACHNETRSFWNRAVKGFCLKHISRSNLKVPDQDIFKHFKERKTNCHKNWCCSTEGFDQCSLRIENILKAVRKSS